MNEWNYKKIGDICRIEHGYAFKSEFFSSSGNLILLSPGNFNESGGLKLKGDKEKYYVGDFPQNYLLRKDDLLIVLTDLIQNAPILGGAGFVPEDAKFLHNQRLGKVVNLFGKQAYKKFFYYCLNDEAYRSQVRSTATGATVRHTAPERIYNCVIPLPTLKTQQKIASILSAYDDLIENNLKRIKLLEEAAQNIYKEWFMYFRFPGYEDAELENGLPKGWERKRLGDVLILNYGKALKGEERVNGLFPVYGSSGIVGFHNSSIATAPGIIIGRKGNVGSVFWAFKDFYPIDTVYYVESSLSYYYLYFNLKGQKYVSSDAAVPGLNRNYAYQLNIIVPLTDVIEKFENVITGVFSQINNLQQQNQSLKTARDILLPRLMNQTIQVD